MGRQGPARKLRNCSAPRKRSACVELLEPRFALTASFVISEFMADNNHTLVDRYGASSDWIEIHNVGDAAGSLNGYYLTDKADNKTKWQFPDVSVTAGGYLVVFATSDHDDRDPAQELHTGFSLSKDGEYLGLIAPDGVTVVQEFAPAFPPQLEDISYGIGNTTTSTTLIASGANVAWLVPSSGALGQSWTQTVFDDSTWTKTRQVPNSQVVLTEINTNTTAVVEVQNVTGLAWVTAGWRVAVGDSSANINSVNSTRWALPNNMSAGQVLYKTDGATNAWGANINWSNTDKGWAMIVDDVGTVVDFVAWGWTAADIAGLNVSFDTFSNITIPNTLWSGNGMALPTSPLTNSYQRVGSSDTNTAANWTHAATTSGTQNSGLSASFGSVSAPATTGVGYERASGYEDLLGTTGVDTAMFNINTSIYIRVPFQLLAGHTFESLKLRVKYDDGFVAYLNGTEIARRNAGGTSGTPLAYSAAGTDHPDAQATVYEEIDISAFRNLLVDGNNVLAFQGLNAILTSTDLLILPELTATVISSQSIGFMQPATPGSSNVAASLGFVAEPVISVAHGFFTAPFPVTITNATPGATIRYTTDGSLPTETNGTLYTAPITISTTATLRAAAFQTDFTPSLADTETYLFLNDVIHQPATAPGPGWPAPTTASGTQRIDYEMDPNIVNDPTWGPQLVDALKAVPTISIVTDLANLFDPTTGIYVHAQSEGDAWERPTSVEYILPDGSVGFQIDAGIRIRGGSSRGNGNPKHALKLYFRNQYEGNLEYPLFGANGPSVFKRLDLRAAQNFSWSNGGDSRMTYLRDIFARDTQRDLDDAYTRGNFFQLYINGVYWGLYQTEERPDDFYGETYFDGDESDYDVIQANNDNYTTVVDQGTGDAWQQLWNMSNQLAATSGATPAATQTLRYNLYLQMQGLNPDGSRNLAYPVLLDVDNLIDFMIVTFYDGDRDGPLIASLGNDVVNNWFGIRNRNGDQGFQFLTHDSEFTFFDVNENRTGPFVGGSTFAYSNPQWIHQQLMFSDEYRQRFADRVQELMFNGGALTTANNLARLNARKAEIDSAIIAESVRWGDSKHEPAYTKTDWLNAVNTSISYINARNAIVLNQLRATTLWNNGSLAQRRRCFPARPP